MCLIFVGMQWIQSRIRTSDRESEEEVNIMKLMWCQDVIMNFTCFQHDVTYVTSHAWNKFMSHLYTYIQPSFFLAHTDLFTKVSV